MRRPATRLLVALLLVGLAGPPPRMASWLVASISIGEVIAGKAIRLAHGTQRVVVTSNPVGSPLPCRRAGRSIARAGRESRAVLRPDREATLLVGGAVTLVASGHLRC